MSMGVYIKGMEMPKPKLAGMVAVYNAYIVVKHNGDAKIVVDNEDKTDSTEYPLVPVPPHGDLVDRAEILEIAISLLDEAVTEQEAYAIRKMWSRLGQMPVYIPPKEE